MNKEQALDVIIQSLDLATQKGVYKLKDVSVILEAIQVIGKEEETPKTTKK